MRIINKVRAGKKLVVLVTLLILNATSGCSGGGSESKYFEENEKYEIIGKLKNLLVEKYIFLDVANSIADELDDQLDNGWFDDSDSRKSFSNRLEESLQSISNDMHLRVISDNVTFLSEDIPAEINASVLDRNIGYIEFERFSDPSNEQAKKNVDNAFATIHDAKALIIDLRNNGGGAPEMVQYIQSHFFDEQPFLLNSIYYRYNDTTVDYYSLEVVADQSLPDIPIYILTSTTTFSAAEGLSYSLQALGRATVIGETTKGGAHPTRTMRLPHGLHARIPIGRSINPITASNWEGVGVIPDIVIVSTEALNTALELISR